MSDQGLLVRAYETLEGYYELGNDVWDEPLARFVRNVDASRIYDANFGRHVRAESAPEVEAVLGRADDVFGGLQHRVFHLDPWTPEAFEAHLVLRGYSFEDEIQLLLEGDLKVARDARDRHAARRVGR